MFEIYNKLEDKTIFSGNEVDLLEFMEKIAIENEDTQFSFLGMSDVYEYMEYCDNLELIED